MIDLNTLSICCNCGLVSLNEQLKCTLPDIPQLFERIEPGGMVPSGTCGTCGSLCYPLHKYVNLGEETG